MRQKLFLFLSYLILISIVWAALQMDTFDWPSRRYYYCYCYYDYDYDYDYDYYYYYYYYYY